ncbi:hypothetical protein GCM10010149_00250 [Nonomuraea roseoviolacea subsp. roseoviolacea]
MKAPVRAGVREGREPLASGAEPRQQERPSVSEDHALEGVEGGGSPLGGTPERRNARSAPLP